MSGGSAGFQARMSAVFQAISRVPRKINLPEDEHGASLKISEFYGLNTFDQRRMREKLPKDVFEKLQDTILTGKKLDLEIANSVAHAVKEWAISQGTTHFCHWFQPQTGLTAEKHDAFLAFDDHGQGIERFSGSQLIQSEPDASSFPSGGMRSTFEARGYTAWDPSSPMFIMESTNGKTLCVPSAFISYHGDALDEKTGLLRSMEAISQSACKLLNLLGDKVNRVVPTLGTEQEYFLVDRAFYSLRQDLVMSGRTLLGARPAKGQQLEDHYFGSIPSRVLAFMNELEVELYKLGVPVKTRHNEVAPSQFEMAPIFEQADVAADHNQLAMDMIKKVARRHDFQALLHEKPFAGLNGNGKHSNWSMTISNGEESLRGQNLLEPGKTPHQNLRFLLFLMGVIRGVHKHSGLLRAGIASSGNDHRLGANEAPPAIISVFMGDTLSKILDKIESGAGSDSGSGDAVLKLGVDKLPVISKDNTDRNRTSPFAFTGNKFEFRAVGSSGTPSFPVTLLNAAVADGIQEIAYDLEKRKKASSSPEAAIFETLKEMIKKTKAVRFEGNNYAEDWVKEAEKRGLLNLRKTPEALAELLKPEAKELLSKNDIFSEDELTSRFNVRIERYIKDLLIEVETLRNMVDTQVMPAALQFHGNLLVALGHAKTAGILNPPQQDLLQNLGKQVSSLQKARAKLETTYEKVQDIENEADKARYLSLDVSAAMEEVRVVCDTLEETIGDENWPLLRYREILFLA